MCYELICEVCSCTCWLPSFQIRLSHRAGVVQAIRERYDDKSRQWKGFSACWRRRRAVCRDLQATAAAQVNIHFVCTSMCQILPILEPLNVTFLYFLGTKRHAQYFQEIAEIRCLFLATSLRHSESSRIIALHHSFRVATQTCGKEGV